MKIRAAIVGLLFAAGFTACATAPEPDPPAPATLGDEAFLELFDAAHKAPTQPAREAAVTALIARDDLTDLQRSHAYYLRGMLRGNYVLDDAMAYPQCAVADYMKMQELAPDSRHIPSMEEDRAYQFSRFRFDTFDDAPQACKDAAVEAHIKAYGCRPEEAENTVCMTDN